MKRAAASAATNPPPSPAPPASIDKHRKKRQRVSKDDYELAQKEQIDYGDVQAAMAAEEAEREEALSRRAPNVEETQWVLSFVEPEKDSSEPVLRVVTAGYAEIDSPVSIRAKDTTASEEKAALDSPLRRTFGKPMSVPKVNPSYMLHL